MCGVQEGLQEEVGGVQEGLQIEVGGVQEGILQRGQRVRTGACCHVVFFAVDVDRLKSPLHPNRSGDSSGLDGAFRRVI